MNNKTKRPSLTALLREQPPIAAPLSPEEQQRIQAENDQKLYGTRLPDMTTPVSTSASVTEVPASGSRGEPAIVGDRWIPFGTYLHDQVYLTLKQAEFWEPGFEIRKFVNKVLSTALAELPGAQQALPDEHLAAVLKKINRTKG